MNFDKNLEKVKKEAEELFENTKEVECPYFKEKVAFNAKGIKHIKFKAERLARERKDQFMRLKNIHLAPVVLGTSSTLQEIQKRKILVKVKTNTRKEKILKDATYYGFISIVKDGFFEKRVKVIVRQIDGGNKHFWSIIPFWNNNKELKLHSGNLEED